MFKTKFNINHPITTDLTAIERARGFLEAATLSEEWIEKMQSQALMLEAHHTTHIEGTQLTLEQSLQIWAGQHLNTVNPDDVKELLNYRNAFDLVSHYVSDEEPITEGLIREIHKQLVKGVRGNSASPGEYRKTQNYVVNSKTKEVIYTPPPAYEMTFMMQELVDCCDLESLCKVSNWCGIKHNWQVINKKVKSIFHELTIQDMLTPFSMEEKNHVKS